MQVIYVNDTLNLEEAEGARLTEDLIVGKQIAGGAQVIHLYPHCYSWSFILLFLRNNVILMWDGLLLYSIFLLVRCIER